MVINGLSDVDDSGGRMGCSGGGSHCQTFDVDVTPFDADDVCKFVGWLCCSRMVTCVTNGPRLRILLLCPPFGDRYFSGVCPLWIFRWLPFSAIWWLNCDGDCVVFGL